MGAFVFSTRSAGATLLFLASDPTDSSTVEIPILSRQLCRAGEPCLTANKNFTYSATSFDLVDGGVDAVDGLATYDAFNPVVGEGAFTSVAPRRLRHGAAHHQRSGLPQHEAAGADGRVA